MNNVIFLDIDGVINDNLCLFSLESINVLKYLIKLYDVKIVIISSWQGNGTNKKRNNIINQLNKFDIYNIDFIDPNYEGYSGDIKIPSRLLGIIDYLKNNLINNYVILDDEYFNDYKLLSLNHYQTKRFKGLTYKDINKITFKQVNLNNFKNVNYQYRQLGNYEKITNDLIRVLKKKL